MKKSYVKPCIEDLEITTKCGFMVEGSKGQVNPETDAMAKRTNITIEDDEEELESFKPEKVVLSDVFSNDYIQKVWE